MNYDYIDIRSRIAEPPLWFDEYAVPRYEPFHPERVSDIYAHEVAYMLIECQACRHEFHVCMSRSRMGSLHRDYTTGEISERWLSDLVQEKTLHYGDPPNIGCCATGLAMSSICRRVVEFWSCRGEPDNPSTWNWIRVPELEVEIDTDDYDQ